MHNLKREGWIKYWIHAKYEDSMGLIVNNRSSRADHTVEMLDSV